MGKSIISVAIFNSYVTNYQRVHAFHPQKNEFLKDTQCIYIYIYMYIYYVNTTRYKHTFEFCRGIHSAPPESEKVVDPK